MNKLPVLLVRSQNRLLQQAPTLAHCTSSRSTNKTALRWSTTTAAASDESSSSSSSSGIINKERILESAMQQVPLYGWTQDAIVAGIQQILIGSINTKKNASLSMAGLFTPRDLVRYHMDHCNQRLRQELPRHLNNNDNNADTTRPAVTTMEDKIARAFQLRLEYSKHLIENNRWHEGMALGVSSSDQAWTTTEQLKEIVNIVVDAVPVVVPEQDNNNTNSNDQYHHHQSTRILSELERIALGGVYVATELHMLTDTSPDYQDTWEFLRQRMNEWKIISSFPPMQAGVGPLVFATGAVGGGGVGDVLSVGRTLSTAFASAAASVLQVNNLPFSTSSSK